MTDTLRHYETLADQADERLRFKPKEFERRENDRHLTTLRVAKLVTESSEGLCIVRNASAGGMMIDAMLVIEPGQIVTIDLNNDHQVEGKVVWYRDGLAGVQFDEALDIDSVLAKPGVLKNGMSPRLPRLEIEGSVELKYSNRSITANICDISQRGVKLSLADELLVNFQITVIMPGFRPLTGSVRWARDNYAGIAFHEIVSISELMAWVAGHRQNET